jgi:hypothetical protein
MAEVSTLRQAPAEFIEAAGKNYLEDLTSAIGGIKGLDVSKLYGSQFVAGPSRFQQTAETLAGGLGQYQPYLQQAGRLAGLAETTLGGIPTDIAAARGTLTGIPTDIATARGTLGTAGADIEAARGMIGPTAYQAYMSPYQQDVIDTSLREYDIQAQKGLPGLAAQAISAGAFGGGREGVQRAEYQSASDRNRAALQAQLLQQGFGQAQQLAAQAQAQRMGIGTAQAGLAAQQLGLGQAVGALAGQQLGVGQAQLGAQMGLAGQQQALSQQQQALAQLTPSLLGQQIATYSTLGAQQQAQEQARLQAQQNLAYQQAYQPLQAAQTFGQGVTGLIAGYPGQTRTQIDPSPSALQTGLSAASTLAGIYRAYNPPAQQPIQFINK